MLNHLKGSTNVIQCIIPPYMLETILMRGTDEQKKAVSDLVEECAQYREARQVEAPAKSFMAAPSVAVGIAPKPKREVYDCMNGTNLPGKLVRKEGDSNSGDQQVDEAYDGTGDTYLLYFKEYDRDSIDGNGMKLISSVHFRQGLNNAYWNGKQMIFGDGDGVIFRPLTGDLAIIGHELSHGVVQFSGGLVYRDQSGALNEHYADVFGVLTKQYKLTQTACDADWLVGAGIFGPDINGEALRSMAAPGTAYDDDLLGKDPQPYHMDDFVNTTSDYGGVHINSGIPNHAFYLLAMMLGGYAWKKAGKIWYDTMQSINNPHATFIDWADETMEQARKIFGKGSREITLAKRAWKLVGVI